MKVKIWIPAYRPFICGGDVYGPVGAEVDGTEVDLGRGFKGYKVRTPAGHYVIADAVSGAIVGNPLSKVRRDVATGDMKIMKEQIADAMGERKRVDWHDPEYLWKYVNGATKRATR